MVYLKVSDGSETRKLQVTPGEITFDQLKQQLATFFPKTLAGEASSGLSLQYRDIDGDVITLSSDQELQEALSQLKEDGVWKLYIRARKGTQNPAPSASSAQGEQQKRNHSERRSLFHHLLEPSVKPLGLFSDIWDNLEQHLQLLHHLHSEVFSSDTTKAGDTKNDTEKGTSESASKLEEEAIASSVSSTDRVKDPDDVVKSKPQKADGPERKPENSGSRDSPNNGWQTKRFLTWEPRLQVGPFGFFHSHLTPVVYNVTYRSSSPSSGGNSGGQCCSRAKGGEKVKTELKSEGEEKAAAASPVAAVPAKDKQVPENALLNNGHNF